MDTETRRLLAEARELLDSAERASAAGQTILAQHAAHGAARRAAEAAHRLNLIIEPALAMTLPR